MTGAELFQWLEENFRYNLTVQYTKADIKGSFSAQEKAALSMLFDAYQATGTIDDILFAVVCLDEKDEAIAYLEKILNCNFMRLKIDPTRWVNQEQWLGTQIFVRAQHPDGGWETVEITLLDKPSLLAWLKSMGGDNRMAENCVGALLGHGSLHEDPQPHPLADKN